MTDRLEELASLPPESKAAKIRAYMPEIEQRLADGVQRHTIIEWLGSVGIEVTPMTFKSYLQRYRAGLRRQTPSLSPTPIPATPTQITDRNTGTDPEPITDGNPDSETPSPEPEPVETKTPKLADILDAKKGNALTDQYMTSRKPLIGRNRSETK